MLPEAAITGSLSTKSPWETAYTMSILMPNSLSARLQNSSSYSGERLSNPLGQFCITVTVGASCAKARPAASGPATRVPHIHTDINAHVEASTTARSSSNHLTCTPFTICRVLERLFI